jgi:hypothetical protein
MRQQQTHPIPRKRCSPLCVEPLEDRRLLSGLTSPLDAPLPTPAGNGPALLALLPPSDAGNDSQTPVPPSEGLAAAVVAVTEAVTAEVAQGASTALSAVRVNAAHDAAGLGLPDLLASLGLSQRSQDDLPSDPQPAFAPGSAPGNPNAEGGQTAGDPNSAPPREGSLTDHGNNGGGSGVSDLLGNLLGSLQFESRGGLTRTDASAGETAAVVPTAQAVGPKASAATAFGAVLRDLVAEAPGLHGPPAPLPVDLLDEYWLRESREARDERMQSPLAAPAREEAPADPVTVALVRQHHNTALPRADTPVDADRQAPALTPLFLAPAGPRAGCWLWGASPDGPDRAAAENLALAAQAALPRAPLQAEQEGKAVEAVFALQEGAELAAAFLPADTTALEQAVRRFLGGLGTVGRELTRVLSESLWARWAVIAAGSALAAEAARRRLQRASRHSAAEEEANATLSWLAGSYPFRPEGV